MYTGNYVKLNPWMQKKNFHKQKYSFDDFVLSIKVVTVL